MNKQEVFTKQKLVSLVSQLFGGYPNPEDPQPPGPWDPYIFGALKRTAYALNFAGLDKVPDSKGETIFGPVPNPWQTIFGPGPVPWQTAYGPQPVLWRVIAARHPELWDVFGGGPLSWIALNPQPLPPEVDAPRAVFMSALASEVINRAMFQQEMADLIPRDGEPQGIIVVGGYINEFADDFCGTNPKIKFPIPVPPPPWFSEEISGLDLIVMGVRFQTAAPGVFNGELRKAFTEAATHFIETGLSKM